MFWIICREYIEVMLSAIEWLSLRELVGSVCPQRKSIEKALYGFWSGKPWQLIIRS